MSFDIFIPTQPRFNPSQAIEPKTGHVWTPHWTVEIGPLVENGKELLPAHLWKQKDLIDRFTVYVLPSQLHVAVDLRTGSITFNNQAQLISGLPMRPHTHFRLIWFRQCEQAMFDLDHNSGAPWCNYYGLGWQATVDGKNIKRGYRILPDGRIAGGLG